MQFPKGMDANEYALKVTPAAKSLAVLLNNAIWLGKGQQPTVGVIEPQTIEEKSEAAAKEKKISETIDANTQEETELPLAAESSDPVEEVPVVAMPRPLEVPVETNGDEIRITQGDRRYRVLGLEKNTTVGLLRVNLLVTRGESLHVDTFDLYSSRHRVIYSKQAGEELGVKEEVVSRDLGKVLWKLEELQRQMIQKTLEPKEQEVTLSAEEKTEALGLLRDPRLLDRILCDFERCGVVGEETNKLASYRGRGVAAARIAAGHPGAIEFRRRKIGADGSGAGDAARRAARAVLGHDRTELVLHGRDRSKTQSAGHRGRRGCLARGLRAETPAERRRTEHRFAPAKTRRPDGSSRTNIASKARSCSSSRQRR